MTAPLTPGGAMNGVAFRAYVDRVPVPTELCVNLVFG